METKRKLTAKERQFCVEYVASNNATEAAIKAKYSTKTARQLASRLLTNVNIQSEIERLKKEQESRTLVTADYVINGFKTVAERCIQGEPVRDRDGNETGEWKFDSSGANQAFKMLGEHLGLFKQTIDVNIKTYEFFKKLKDEYGFNGK